MGTFISTDITASTYVRARLVVEYTANASANNNSCKAYVQMWRTNTGYTTSGNGKLYIKTEDDNDWWTSNILDEQKVTYNSYTLVGSARTLTINCDSTGRRTIKFSVKTTMNSVQNLAFDTQTFSVTLAPCPVYTLSVSAGTGSSITVNRTSSAGGNTGNITAGAKKLYYGDKLKITFTPGDNYGITTHTVNGADFTSGNTHTVNADVAVKSTATQLKSSVAATDANIGSTSSIIITRHNSAYTHTLAYKFGSLTGTIPVNATETTIPWTVPTEFYTQIPNDPSGTCTITCTTYNGSTPLGSVDCTMTATAAKNICSPVVRIEAVDSNAATIALTGNNKHIVKFHSDVKVTAAVEPQNGARIKNTTLKCGNVIANAKIKTFTDAESIDISATATDSREYTTTESVTDLTLINYIKLTTNATAERTSPTSDKVIVNTKGNYYNGSFGAVNNTLRLQVQYKPKSKPQFEESDTWAEMAVTINGDTYTAQATLTGLDYTQAYDIRVRASDQIYNDGDLAEAIYHNVSLSKGIPVFDWGEEDFNFNVPVTITGNLLNDFVIEQGTDGIWIYRKWASGIAECWGVSDAITQTTSTDWNVTTSNTPTPSIEYPFAFKNPPVVSPSVHIHDGNFWLVTYGAGSTTHTPTYQIARGKSQTTITFKLGYYVFGQWK